MMNKIVKILFIIFVGCILISGIIFLNFTGDVSEKENRALAKFPNRLPFHEAFPKEFDEWVNDRVGLREMANNFYRKYSKYDFSHYTISKRALIGEDNWLFFNDEGDVVKYFQGRLRPSKESLDKVSEIVIELESFCHENNIKCYFMIPPNKTTIYSEYYPKWIKVLNNEKGYNIIYDYLSQKGIDLTNLYDLFMKEKEKNNGYLYYKAGTHWNKYGGYIAYYDIASKIKKDFPTFNLLEKDDVEFCKSDINVILSDSLIGLVSLNNYIHDLNKEICIKNPYKINISETKDINEFSFKQTDNKNGLKLMFFGDSFYLSMENFIVDSVKEVKYMRFYYKSPLKYKDDILSYKPDIIIFEILERYIANNGYVLPED